MTSVTDNQALLENLLLSLLGRNGTTENVENVDPSTFVQESKSDTKKKSINEGEGEGESEDKSGDDQSEEGADSSKSGEGKKKKAGRKRVETEAKSKRVAQNREAQRAFRKRKQDQLDQMEQEIVELRREKERATSQLSELQDRLGKLERENKALKQSINVNPNVATLSNGAKGSRAYNKGNVDINTILNGYVAGPGTDGGGIFDFKAPSQVPVAATATGKSSNINKGGNNAIYNSIVGSMEPSVEIFKGVHNFETNTNFVTNSSAAQKHSTDEKEIQQLILPPEVISTMLSTNNEGITDPGLGVGAMGLDALGVFSTSTHATDSPFSEYLGNGNYYDGKGIYTESPESNVTKVEEDENEEGGESLGSRTGSGLIQDLATFFENKEKIGRLGSKGKMGRVVNVGTSSSTGEAEFGNLFDELVSSNGDVDGWIESPLNISQNVPQNIPQITNRNQSIDEQNINHCIGLVGQNSNVDNYSGYYNENDGENILGMGMGMEPSSGLTLSCNELDELCMLLKKHAKCADVLKSISNQYTQ